jgi:photosystem II Psb27 protein
MNKNLNSFTSFVRRLMSLVLVTLIVGMGILIDSPSNSLINFDRYAAAALIGSGKKVVTNKEILEQANAGMTGNYVEDTQAVVNSLRFAVGLDPKDPKKIEAQTDARFKINSYASRYRRDSEKLGLTSFTTLRTALNALASYYNGTTKRSVPPKIRDRVILELDRVDQALAQGR